MTLVVEGVGHLAAASGVTMMTAGTTTVAVESDMNGMEIAMVTEMTNTRDVRREVRIFTSAVLESVAPIHSIKIQKACESECVVWIYRTCC